MRWEGEGGPNPGSELSRAQDYGAPLERGDIVAVWLDPFSRGGRAKEGTARLEKFQNRVTGRAPLEVWKVSLCTLELGDGRGPLQLREERASVSFVHRVVHPADRLARGADVPTRPKEAPELDQSELDPERRR